MGITNSVTWVTEIFSPSLLNFIVYIPMYVSGIKHTESFFCSSISSSAFFIWYQSTDPGALKKSSSPFYHKQPSHVQDAKMSEKPSLTDPSHPYYVHHSDQPGHMLVPTKLNGSNYQSWKKSMTHALIAKKKLDFVDDTIAMPS